MTTEAARPCAYPTCSAELVVIAASEVMVGLCPGLTLGEALVPRPVPPMTNWEALEAML